MSIPRLKSRPRNDDSSSGVATSVADRISNRARSKFSHCKIESETQRSRRLQPCANGDITGLKSLLRVEGFSLATLWCFTYIECQGSVLQKFYLPLIQCLYRIKKQLLKTALHLRASSNTTLVLNSVLQLFFFLLILIPLLHLLLRIVYD